MNSRPVYCSRLYGNELQDEEDELEVTKSNTLVNETGFLMRIQKLLPALETLVITQEGNDPKSMPKWKISDLTNVLHAIGTVYI